jgi:mono/diheme cytochrome c family protein
MVSTFHVKLIALLIFLFFIVAACTTGGTRRYSIAESKTYEASLFRQNCAICHGPEGEGKTLMDGRVVPGLRNPDGKYRTDAEIYRHITDGGNGMVPFRNILTEREINLMVNFVQKDLRGNNS